MDQVDTEDGAGESAGVFVFRSRPNHSLTRPQERLVFWSLAALCLASAIAFARLGYWPILPFAGLEMILLAWALRRLRTRAGDFELLTISGDRMVLEWRVGTREGHREMNRQWVRVVCDCKTPGRSCHLSVRSHGRATEVGQFLSDEGRLQLAATLRSRCRDD